MHGTLCVQLRVQKIAYVAYLSLWSIPIISSGNYVTDSSVKAYSAFSCYSRTEIKIPAELRDDDLHVWLCCRDRFSDSDAFKRHVLAHYVGVAPLALNFEFNAHGKPLLLNGPSKLDFNISHSGSWLACGVPG